MYSGEPESDNETEIVEPTKFEILNKSETEFLKKLNSLKSDCLQLHQTLENALKTSGICKRYTTKNGHKPLADISNIESNFKKKAQKSPRTTTTKVKENVKKTASPRKPPSKLQTFVMLEKQKRQIKKYQEKRKELNEKHHLIPLKPKPSILKPILAHKNGNSRYNRQQRHKTPKRKQSFPPKNTWIPKPTVPEPFMFTLREATTPIRANYALKFLEKMMEEKEQKEEQEKMEFKKQFYARPVPETTYVSNSSFYVGRLKKDQNASKQPPFRFANGLRSKSEPNLSNREKIHPFKAHPIPMSTYIRPKSSTDEEREQKRIQRSMEMLLLSQEPFGMNDHSIRSSVQYRIRHLPHCYEKRPSFQPKIIKNVPDFRVLQRDFQNKLQEIKEHRPSTMAEPFRFHDKEITRHFCDNMKSKPTVVKFYKTSSKSGKESEKSKISTRTTVSSSSNQTFNTFNVA